MFGIIVSGHGEFASAFKKTVEYIIGKQEKIKYINFNNQMNKKDLYETFKSSINDLNLEEGILFITDLLGGTPFSVAAEISLEKEDKIKVIGGSNIPTLIAALEIREETDNFENEITNIVKSGKEELSDFKNILQNEIDDSEDGI